MKSLVLASSSAARAQMLRNAGVNIVVKSARIDESAVKSALAHQNTLAPEVADTLAAMKAEMVARICPQSVVLGADQVLVCDGVLYDKPATLDDARAQLLALRGKTHELLSAAVIYVDGAPAWRHVGRAQLHMRQFSDSFLDSYIMENGNGLLTTVGGYKLEGVGAQLFSQIQGDYFTVLGLPLLDVLAFLRKQGICKQ